MLLTLAESLLSIFLLSLIPFLVYTIKNKTVKGFFSYIGIKKSNHKSNFIASSLSLLLFFPFLILVLTNTEFKDLMFDPTTKTGQFRLMGFGLESSIILIITAVLNTSLAEEIFFRGFIAKRLINMMGFKIGNLIQASIFAIVHSILFFTITEDIILLLVVTLIPFTVAYFIPFVNEKLANGSIIPGWIAHGLANILSFSIIGFMI